jgi:hypothetical protein
MTTKYYEQRVFYKLQFSMGQLTLDEGDWVRKAMIKLEKQTAVMKCFQNWERTSLLNHAPDFSVYYREENVESINKFIFKMQLKFPNFVLHTTQTLQEFS